MGVFSVLAISPDSATSQIRKRNRRLAVNGQISDSAGSRRKLEQKRADISSVDQWKTLRGTHNGSYQVERGRKRGFRAELYIIGHVLRC